MQTARDHEMDDEPEVAVETERNTFADAANLAHDATLDARKRRIRGAQHERAAFEANALERLADDARHERGDVGGYVR
jgi:hypothetical protein